MYVDSSHKGIAHFRAVRAKGRRRAIIAADIRKQNPAISDSMLRRLVDTRINKENLEKLSGQVKQKTQHRRPKTRKDTPLRHNKLAEQLAAKFF